MSRSSRSARRWSTAAGLAWIAPSIAFFFNYRTLSTYWYFNIFPFAVELVASPLVLPEPDARPWNRRRIAAGLAAAVAVALAAVLYARAHAGDYGIALTGPIRTWNEHATRIDLRLTNTTAKMQTPRFWCRA